MVCLLGVRGNLEGRESITVFVGSEGYAHLGHLMLLRRR